MKTAARFFYRLFLILLVASMPQWAAATSGITYTGRILDAVTDQPVTLATSFTLQILSADATCTLYAETHTLSGSEMTAGNGTFSLELGNGGSPTYYGDYNSTAAYKNLYSLFDNTARTWTGNSACTFTPALTDGRILRVTFNTGVGGVQSLPDLKINPVPLALQAYKITGFAAGDLLRVDSAVDKTTYANTALNQAQYNEFWKLLLGTSTAYLGSATSFGGDASGTYSALTVNKIKNVSVDTTGIANGKILKYDGTKFAMADDNTGATGDASYAAKGIVEFDTDAATSGISVTTGVAKVNMGTSAGQVVQLVTGGKLPAVDGSNLTNVVSSANVASALGYTPWQAVDATYSTKGIVSFNTDANTSGISVSSGSVTVQRTTTGTANNILSLDGSSVATAKGFSIQGSSSGTATLQAPTTFTSYSLTLPAATPVSGQVLSASSGTALSWTTPASSLSSTLNSGYVYYGNASNVGVAVNAADNFVMKGGQAGAFTIGTTDATALTLSTNSSPRITMDSAGNTGIGNASPAGTLDVGGAILGNNKLEINRDGNSALVLLNSYRASGLHSKIRLAGARGSLATPANLSSADVAGELRFSGWMTGTTWGDSGLIQVVAPAAQTSTSTPGRMEFYTTNSGATSSAHPQMSITHDGLVGIGFNSTAPQGSLHIYNTAGLDNSFLLGDMAVKGFAIRDAGNGIDLASSNADLYINNSAGATTFINGSNGAVVIGATDPAMNVLDLRGNMAIGTYGATQAAPANGLIVSGNVGIGVITPSTKLQVAGEIAPSSNNAYSLGDSSLKFTAVYAVNGTIQTSDRREKKNIETSDLGLDFINQLVPVSYNWKSGEDKNTHYGLIAQDTEAVIDQFKAQQGKAKTGGNVIVSHDEKTDAYGIKYTELISPMIKAIQELYESVTHSEARISALEKENQELKARLDRLEQKLGQ